jgi:hypothetical protein
MFKITLGALIASCISIFLPSRIHRMYFTGVLFLIFVVIEIIFIASGGD